MPSEIVSYEEETLRKVHVQLLPLDWVYVTNKTYSALFTQFRIFYEKYEGSFVMGVMFD